MIIKELAKIKNVTNIAITKERVVYTTAQGIFELVEERVKVRKQLKSGLSDEKVINYYNERFKYTNAVMKLKPTSVFKNKLTRFINSELKTIEDWELYFDNVEMIPFLMGKIPPSNGHKQFRLSLEWLIKPANLAKIIEGFYTNA